MQGRPEKIFYFLILNNVCLTAQNITKPYRQGLRLDTFSSGKREPFCPLSRTFPLTGEFPFV